MFVIYPYLTQANQPHHGSTESSTEPLEEISQICNKYMNTTTYNETIMSQCNIRLRLVHNNIKDSQPKALYFLERTLQDCAVQVSKFEKSYPEDMLILNCFTNKLGFGFQKK